MHLDRPRTLLFLPVVELPDKAFPVVVLGEFERAMIKRRGPVILGIKGKGVLVARLHGCARTKEPELVAGVVGLLPISLDLPPQRLFQREANMQQRGTPSFRVLTNPAFFQWHEPIRRYRPIDLPFML